MCASAPRAASAQATPPVIDSLGSSANLIYPGVTVQLVVAAHDPGGGALAYTWTATGGSLAPVDSSASWTAPGAPGTYTVSVSVTSAGGTTTASAAISVVWAKPDASYGSPAGASGFYPERVSVDAAGFAYVSNPRKSSVQIFTPHGLPLREIAAGGLPAGVAAGAGGRIYVSLSDRGAVRVLDQDGRGLGSLGAGDGEFLSPVDVAVNAATGAVYVADAGARAVRIFDAAGKPAGALATTGGYPVGVAVDPASGRVFVSDGGIGKIRIFNAAGLLLGTAGTFGGRAGQITRIAGVAVGNDGNVYVADAFQGQVSVFAPTGPFIATVGSYGAGAGQLDIPVGIAADASGHLVVASTQQARLERFALQGAQAPQCPRDDADCDGMPDWWEILHHLNPLDPRDAYADSDGDGLVNVLEYRLGTDPWNPDTDGDGVSDGAEVAAGGNPLDPYDHVAGLFPGASRTSDPGLVRLSASARGPGTCSVAWKQVAGPRVTLRGADTFSPAFVGRAAGQYQFQGIATCGSVKSKPAILSATIVNVPPRADPGRIQVVEAGGRITLDGTSSSDANGDKLVLAWDQDLGRPLAGHVRAGALGVRVERPGLYGFTLTARDRAGASSQAEVPVVSVDDGRPAPTAVASTPVFGQTGAAVMLDASGSYVRHRRGADYSWRQVDGPSVALGGADPARPTFLPPVAGRYGFEVSVASGGFRSPPARVDVLVSDPGVALPRAAAQATGVVSVGEPVALDGSGSAPGAGGTLAYRWRQVSGPAAGLTDADLAVATAVPFATGSHVFELVVSEGGAVSVPAKVRIDAGSARPVAVASGPAVVQAGHKVRLDGSGSTGPARKTLRYCWTQVAGPWVALDEPDRARPEFESRVPGVYAFELEVDDGTVRSAPATVSILVLAAKDEEDSR